MTIKNFYCENYPSDELGKEINENAHFTGLLYCLYNNRDVYNFIGVFDSIVRERVFEKLAKMLRVDYNEIYSLWLNEKIDLNENQPTLYLKEQPTEVRKWCRKCNVTGVGTDEGFVHYDGDFITITEEATAKVLREDLRDGVYDALEEYLPEQFDNLSDNEVIEWCFENTSLYFNEWNLEEEIKFGGYYFIEYSDGSIKQA